MPAGTTTGSAVSPSKSVIPPDSSNGNKNNRENSLLIIMILFSEIKLPLISILQLKKGIKEENNIYSRKSELFQQYNTNGILPHADDLLNLVKEKKLTPVLVTGSGQPSLLDKLDHHFPGIFNPDTMVTAFNVTKGKPDPEPYIMGLEKGNNLLPNQAIVIENAPLGIKSAVGAGIFTIAVNTGPLQDKVLTDAGAALVFHSIKELYENFNLILDNINKINL